MQTPAEIIEGDRHSLSLKAAQLIETGIKSCLHQQHKATLAVPGGSSVSEIFQVLGGLPIAWQQVHIFPLDERLVALDHEESNFRLIAEQLGKNVPQSALHPFICGMKDPQQGIDRFQSELAGCGGRYDIVLASSGEDGHIASIFPDHHSVTDDKSEILLMDDAPKPPPGRMSAGLRLIRRAKLGIILFFGQGKRAALHNFLSDRQSLVQCPAKVFTELPRYIVLTDQETKSL